MAALGVFAKWPEPGRAKTRLAAATSPEWAAGAARAFLLDTLHLTRKAALAQPDLARYLVFSPAGRRDDFAGLPDAPELLPQTDGHLGDRMRAFAEHALAAGHRRVLLLGTDTPHLPPATIRDALTALGAADVVIGPAADGGYYLIGVRDSVPPVFAGPAWGTSSVLSDTAAALAGSPHRLALLPAYFDIDAIDDWHALAGLTAAAERAGRPLDMPHVGGLPAPPARPAEG